MLRYLNKKNKFVELFNQQRQSVNIKIAAQLTSDEQLTSSLNCPLGMQYFQKIYQECQYIFGKRSVNCIKISETKSNNGLMGGQGAHEEKMGLNGNCSLVRNAGGIFPHLPHNSKFLMLTLRN